MNYKFYCQREIGELDAGSFIKVHQFRRKWLNKIIQASTTVNLL